MEYEKYHKMSNMAIRRNEVSKEKQTGYQPSDKEKQKKLEPKEVMNLKCGTGVISLGINRKREVTVAISSDNDGQLREDKKNVSMNSSVKMSNTNKVYTNSHEEKESGVVIKIPYEKQSYGLEQKLKLVAEKLYDNVVMNDVVPFLTQWGKETEHQMEQMNKQQDRDKLEHEFEQEYQMMLENKKKKSSYYNGLILDALSEWSEDVDDDIDGMEVPDDIENPDGMQILYDIENPDDMQSMTENLDENYH